MDSRLEHAVPQRNWLHSLGDLYDDNVLSRAHPEVMNWPLVKSDWPAVTIIFCYVFFINNLGPRLMKNRKPFDLRWLMVPYNIFLVFANFFIFFEYAKARWNGGEETNCEPNLGLIDPVKYQHRFRMAEITWYFYITKYIELFDTVFFVLRKKERQLSKLHKVHHSTVPILVGLMLRGAAGGYNSFFPLANSFVHCVMYTYYGISALGDDVTIHLKFKKYVTITQMIQFILVLYFFISRPFYGCQWNPYYGIGNIILAGFFFVLFLNFYLNEYVKAKKEAALKNGIEKHKEM